MMLLPLISAMLAICICFLSPFFHPPFSLPVSLDFGRMWEVFRFVIVDVYKSLHVTQRIHDTGTRYLVLYWIYFDYFVFCIPLTDWFWLKKRQTQLRQKL